MSAAMTAVDFDMALFFIKERGDVTRWCDWPSKREALLAAVPEMDDWLRAQRVSEALGRDVVRQLEALAGSAE